MSLSKSLSQPLVQPLVKSLNSDINDQAAFARELLVENYPFQNSLTSNIGNTATFTRASEKNIRNVLGDYLNFANNAPAFTGISIDLEGASSNKLTIYNLAPDAGLTNITDGTNITTSREDDTANLEMFKVDDLISKGVMNGFAFKSVSADAAYQDVTLGGVTGNTNNHSAVVFIRGTTSEVRLKLGGVQIATVTPSNTDDYVALVALDVTPALATDQLSISIPAGETVYWIASILEENSFLSSLIETQGITGNRAADDLSVSTSGYATNNVAYLLYYPQGIKDIGIQWLLDSRVDANNRFDVIALASGDLRYRKEVGGSVTQATAAFSYDSPLYALIKQTDTSGQDVLLSNGNTASNPDTSAIVYDSIIQIGAQDDSFGTSSLFAPFAQFKRFEGTGAQIDELTLNGAIYA